MSARQAVLFAMLAFPAGAQEPQAARRVRIALLELRAVGDEARAATISAAARAEASRIPGVEVIDRAGVAAALGADGRPGACPEDGACLRDLGGRLAVDHFLVGALSPLGPRRRLSLALVDPRSARTEAEFAEAFDAGAEELSAGARRLVHRLLDPLAERAAPATRSKASLLVAPPVVLVGRGIAPPLPAAGEAPAPRGSARRRWGLVSAGTGLAMVAGGAAFGLMARSSYEDERRASQGGDLAAYEASRSAARRRARIADALFAAGAVGIGVGVALRVGGQGAAELSLSAAPAPGGLVAGVGGRF